MMRDALGRHLLSEASVERARAAGDRGAELAIRINMETCETLMSPEGAIDRLEALLDELQPELDDLADDFCTPHRKPRALTHRKLARTRRLDERSAQCLGDRLTRAFSELAGRDSGCTFTGRLVVYPTGF
jgi:hypothetical protein